MAGRKPKKIDPEKTVRGFCAFTPIRPAGGTVVLFDYMQLTEKHTPEEWQKLERGELTPAQQALRENPVLMPLLLDLRTLFQISSYNTMLTAYKAGKITPDLQKILIRTPSVGATDNGDGRFYSVSLDAFLGNSKPFEQAIINGNLDFSPFKNQDEKEKLWFLLYRTAPNPVPGYFGSIANWDRTVKGNKTTLEEQHAIAKARIKATVTEALQNGVNPAAILTIADDIKKAYDENTKAGRGNVWNGLFRHGTEYETGFVVDITDGKIFDLRPYTNELLELLEPGFEPLKEFYYALRRYVKDYETANREQTQDEPEPTETLLPDDPFLMLQNSPESNAITSASGGIAAVTVQQQLDFEGDGDSKSPEKWNYTTNVKTKTDEFIIHVKETPRGRALDGGTEKLRTLCDTLFTLSGQMNFPIPIAGYMKLKKRNPDEPIPPVALRKMRRKMLNDFETLHNTTFDAWVKGVKAPGFVGIIRNAYPIPGDRIMVEMEPRYCESLISKRAGVMQMTRAVYWLDERNPHLIPLLRKLSYNRTLYSNINTNQLRAHRISIKSLYEYDNSFPSIKKLMKTRRYREDAINPMINAIKILIKDRFIEAVFVDNDGIEHTADELERVPFTDFIDPQKWLLDYELLDPYTGEKFKDNPEQIKKALERKAEREEQKTVRHARKVVAAANRKKREAQKKKEQEQQ